MAYKVFTNGSVLNASEINENLMRQSVAVFSNAAARTAAITSPVEGQLTYLEDVDRYESYVSSSWVQLITPGAWTNYTPILSNITLGNGTLTSKYTKIGRTVNFSIIFVWGSTSSATGLFTFSLPLARATNSSPLVNVTFEDTGTSVSPGFFLTSGDNLLLLSIVTSGVTAAGGGTGATSPFTWTTNDVIFISGTYETSV